MANHATTILSAREFIEQGTPAGVIMSIAASQTQYGARGRVEAIAREVANRTGQSLQIPGAATKARENARRRPANDNRGRGDV